MMVVISSSYVVQNAIDAMSLGALYALAALGIALIFGIMQLINFAHAQFMLVAAYVLVFLPNVPFPLLVVIAVLAATVAALVTERIAFRPARGADPATLLVTSFAVSFLLQSIGMVSFGTLARTTQVSAWLAGSWTIDGLVVPRLSIVLIVTVSLMLGALVLFLQRSTLGIHMRAAAEDFEITRALGVKANTVVATAFAISGVLAGTGGVFLAAQTGTVTPSFGSDIVLMAFIATILGGMGSMLGAVIGGFAIGTITVVLQAIFPLGLRPFRDVFVFTLVVVVLLVRPHGLIVSRSITTRV